VTDIDQHSSLLGYIINCLSLFRTNKLECLFLSLYGIVYLLFVIKARNSPIRVLNWGRLQLIYKY